MKILLPLSFILLVFCCSTNGKSGNAAESQNVSSKPFYLMSTDELISLGQKYRNEGNFAESMRVLYFASNMTTENPKTHFERGKTYLEYAASVRDYNYFNAASQEFQRALLNDKDNEAECESLIGLAECQASMLFMVPNMQQTGEGVQHFVRAAQLKPNDLEIQKKLLCLNIISGQFSLTETMLKELAGKLDGDPVYHELAATNFAIQAARNKPAEPEEFEEAFEHLLRAVELSLNESKKEKPATKGDIFFELVQGYSSPMTKLRELVAPDDLPKYVKHVRELKTKNRELYRMIARARLMRPFNNQYDKQPFEMRYMLFGDDPVFCLEYAFSHDFRNTQGHDIAKILTEKMIKDGRFVITGRFYRGDATCWLGVGTNQKELFEQSIPDFEATVKAVPNWDYACLKLGWAYLHSQQFDKAQVTFLQGIAINPDSIPLRTALLDTQLRKSSSGRIDPEMAASLAEWGMRHNRNDFASRCQVLLRSKELLKFETAPGAMSPSEIAKEAQNLVAEKKTEQAVNRYLRLAEHDPNPDTSLTGYYLYENLGTLYYQQKNWEKTVETLACTIKIESPIYDQPPYPIEMMFEALHHLKKHDDIVGLYKIIVAGTPDYFAQGRKSLYYVGYAMNETRRNPKEIFKVVQPMINDPTLHLVDDMALWKFVADMAKRAGENEVFVAIQERHIQQDPFSIGDFHLQEKNYDQAVASYEYALDYNETIQDKKEIRRKIATVLLGSIAEQPGAAENPARAEKAVEHLKQLVFDEPENRDFWEMLLRAAKIA
ncbi:MAG: hypothetical protein FWC50_02085, partial [Planctomycetaceae bacterium]|nr:hypothetical protein [Planctomycetaceae bacterium]